MKNHTIINTRAYAKNRFNHNHWSAVLDGDHKWSDADRCEAAEIDGRHLCTQAQADGFIAHTDVRFEVIEITIIDHGDDEDTDISERVLFSANFEVGA